MEKIKDTNDFSILKLTKKVAEKYTQNIAKSLDQIPETDSHSAEYVMGEKKDDRILHGKWQHSFIALNNNEFAGVIIGYEREAEDNSQYPDNCIYLSALAVEGKFQKKGLGRLLCTVFIEKNKKLGFKYLDGKLKFRVQTNKANWNNHVQKLYESVGFLKTAEKKYDNREDNIYTLTV